VKIRSLPTAGLSAPETLGLLPGDSGVYTPETLGQGPETPAQVFGAVFRGVSLFSVMGAETSPEISARKVSLAGDSGLLGRRLRPPGHLARRLQSLEPGDSGLKRLQRLVLLQGLYKGFFHLKSRLRLLLSLLHCCQASKL
jgi:hypothetical protein